MTPRLAALVLLAALLSCNDGTAPTVDLNGAWTTGMVPSGDYTELYLTTTGEFVTGTARWQFGLYDGPLVTYSVAGLEWNGTFALTLTPDSGAVVTYAGKVIEPDKLAGTWSAGRSSGAWSFIRCSMCGRG